MDKYRNQAIRLICEGAESGEIRMNGTVIIYGKTARVAASEEAVIYGVVEGDVVSPMVKVYGKVCGAIVSKNVVLGPRAVVNGNIATTTLTIEKGCTFSNVAIIGERGAIYKSDSVIRISNGSLCKV